VYEVEAVLDEDELGGRGFLIRWAGFGPDHDSWEPEENVAEQLVDDFREARRLMRNHQGTDYKASNTRMLWCCACCTHTPADSFSSNMRRAEARVRKCLQHHYKIGGGGSPASASATPARASVAARKRSREEADVVAASPVHSARSAPPAPMKVARPIARSLSHRQAALEVQKARLFGL